MTVKNTLAYYKMEWITTEKVLIMPSCGILVVIFVHNAIAYPSRILILLHCLGRLIALPANIRLG